MENNQKDFMKNRPVAASANQIKDVYTSQKASTRTTLTAVLVLAMIVCIILSIVWTNWCALAIFVTVLAALLLSLIVGGRADRSNAPVVPHDSPDAIFKEHEE